MGMRRLIVVVCVFVLAVFSASIACAELVAHYPFDGDASDETGI